MNILIRGLKLIIVSTISKLKISTNKKVIFDYIFYIYHFI